MTGIATTLAVVQVYMNYHTYSFLPRSSHSTQAYTPGTIVNNFNDGVRERFM